MIKTLRRIIRQDKERFVIPKGVQQVIPIRALWPDGIFFVGNKFSKSYRFEDINYAVASREDKEAMFLSYSELLNSFDSGATTKITIHNRRMNRADFESSILIPLRQDHLDVYRQEYNEMLLAKATGANGTIQEKYVTISVVKKNVEEARQYFARVGTELMSHFSRLGSKCIELDATDRLRIFHDFFRIGEEADFRFHLSETMRKGHDFKDFICPDTFEFEKDHFRMGNFFGRVIFLREYASYIKDSMVSELCDLNRNLLLSLDIIPIPTDEAVREVESRLLGVETNITNWQRRQNRNNNFSAVVPYDMEQQRKESKEFLNDLTTRDQRMMFGLLTMVHIADSKEQLDSDTEALLTTARKHLCQFSTLTYQQMDGLNTALPYGLRKIHALRTLTTESTAVFIPFRAQEIIHPGGIYYGQNVISKNMIIANRKQLLNGNSFILGVSGSGKSFTAKREIVNQMLASDDDIILIDPEREYSALVNALGGETIHISATSPNHINAMDMNRQYGDGANPIILKSEFVLSLCEQLIGGYQLGAKEKSLIDRCTASVYRKFLQSNYKGQPPTLQDFRAELMRQAEPEAQDIALAIELFTSGSLNTFAKPTNVNVHNRLICYDILDLGKQLLPIGMLVVLDSILNRITQNRVKGKNTFIIIDEIYLLFQHEYSANFLFTLWKRVRKYGAFCTGITQNVDDLLQSHTARTMLANSEFIVMLNQAATDRVELAGLLNISELQLSYITNVDAGNGLMKVGSSLVPFSDKFPRHTKLYSLMTTKPGE
ncbi:VirB4-like conjugal transfer ATPase, CD1110 family [Paenibacillus naphthalenovorans]|uniref:AAA-like domain-containing protein n=1 Tax=Paenibacillus naphthalenovorans TaxID=162209 RepID=A0A0U2VP50_9BACL|nr:ATP-binding protein [Paenibacillus naphthalenovorans]ALS25043.1 AAA-like domain-containing protein [Paenibacillus naphthalenovorans]